MRKIRNQNAYKVFNKITGVVHSKHTTLDKAKSQVRLLSALDKKGAGVESNLYTDRQLNRMSMIQLVALRERTTDPALLQRIAIQLEGRDLAANSPTQTGQLVQQVPMAQIQLPAPVAVVPTPPPQAQPINLFGLVNPRPPRQRPPTQVLIDNRRRPREEDDDENKTPPPSKKSRGKGIKKGAGTGGSKEAAPPTITKEMKKKTEKVKKQIADIEEANKKKSEEIKEKISKARKEQSKKIAKEDPDYVDVGLGLKGGEIRPPQPPTIESRNTPSTARFIAPDGRIIVVTGQRNIEVILRSRPDYQLIQEGGGLPAGDIQKLLKNSYQIPPANNIGDFVLDKELSGRRVQVYKNRNTPQAVVVHRGTQGLKDWSTDLFYATGGDPKQTNRFKHAADIQKKAESKYGAKNITTLGHSLGAKISSTVGQNSKEIINLNKAVSPLDAIQQTSDKEINIRTSGDAVSALLPLRNSMRTITIPSTTYNPFTEHKTETLNRLPADQIIGKGAAVSAIRGMFRGKPYVVEALDRIEDARDKAAIIMAVFSMMRKYNEQNETPDLNIISPFAVLFAELSQMVDYDGGIYWGIGYAVIENPEISVDELRDIVIDWIRYTPEFESVILNNTPAAEAGVVEEPPMAEARIEGKGAGRSKNRVVPVTDEIISDLTDDTLTPRNELPRQDSLTRTISDLSSRSGREVRDNIIADIISQTKPTAISTILDSLTENEISRVLVILRNRRVPLRVLQSVEMSLNKPTPERDPKIFGRHSEGNGVKSGGRIDPYLQGRLENARAERDRQRAAAERNRQRTPEEIAAEIARIAAERALFDAFFDAQRDLEAVAPFEQHSTTLSTRPAYRAFYNLWSAYTNLRNGVPTLQTPPQQVDQFMLEQYNRIRGQFSPTSNGLVNRDGGNMLLNRRSDEVLSELQAFVLNNRDRTVPEENIFGNTQVPTGEYTAAEIARLTGESPPKRQRGRGIKKGVIGVKSGGAIAPLRNPGILTNIQPLTINSSPEVVFDVRRRFIQFFMENVEDGMTINQFSSVAGFIREQAERIIGLVNTGGFGVDENTIVDDVSTDILEDLVSIPSVTTDIFEFLFGLDNDPFSYQELQEMRVLRPDRTADGEYRISGINNLLREYLGDDIASPYIDYDMAHYIEPEEQEGGGNLAKIISPPIKKMVGKTNPWIEYVKSFAKGKGINYRAALKHPDISKGYKKGGMVEEDKAGKGMIVNRTVAVRGRGMPTTREANIAESYNESQLGANGGRGYVSL